MSCTRRKERRDEAQQAGITSLCASRREVACARHRSGARRARERRWSLGELRAHLQHRSAQPPGRRLHIVQLHRCARRSRPAVRADQRAAGAGRAGRNAQRDTLRTRTSADRRLPGREPDWGREPRYGRRSRSGFPTAAGRRRRSRVPDRPLQRRSVRPGNACARAERSAPHRPARAARGALHRPAHGAADAHDRPGGERRERSPRGERPERFAASGQCGRSAARHALAHGHARSSAVHAQPDLLRSAADARHDQLLAERFRKPCEPLPGDGLRVVAVQTLNGSGHFREDLAPGRCKSVRENRRPARRCGRGLGEGRTAQAAACAPGDAPQGMSPRSLRI
jgi:hypothetical protein